MNRSKNNKGVKTIINQISTKKEHPVKKVRTVINVEYTKQFTKNSVNTYSYFGNNSDEDGDNKTSYVELFI